MTRKQNGLECVLQSQTAHGHLTGTGKGEQSGDALFEGNPRSGKWVAMTLWIEAERLAGERPQGFSSCSDKNGQHLLERNSQKRAKPLIASAVSLVAGNVTGGGGKATTTKT
ncbi:MAG: hypothetical protein R2747_22435 [Pyrinomonadaceae bacterium]